jgi:uncharacterized Fe-S center protein
VDSIWEIYSILNEQVVEYLLFLINILIDCDFWSWQYYSFLVSLENISDKHKLGIGFYLL